MTEDVRTTSPAYQLDRPGVKAQWIGFFLWLGVTFAASAIGGYASVTARSFYSELVRPDWFPPGSVFGPVWMVLYTMMGIAAWLIWREGGFRAASAALWLYLVQLTVNALWSWTYFQWKSGPLSFGVIMLLWVLILMTIFAFRKIRPLAAGLLVPYVLWVTFAAVLNFITWRLNPEVLG